MSYVWNFIAASGQKAFYDCISSTLRAKDYSHRPQQVACTLEYSDNVSCLQCEFELRSDQ